MNYVRARKWAALAAAMVVVAGLLAACGSSSSTSSSSSSSAAASGSGGRAGFAANRAKLAACLKQHGVTLPARPAGSGGGAPGGGSDGSGSPPAGGSGSGGYGSGGGPGGGGFFGGGGGGGGGRFANNPKFKAAIQACGGANFRAGRRFHLSQTAITKYVTCVKQHGYTLPKPNFSGKGAVFPSSIESNPKFQAASKACRSVLMPAGGASGGGSGGGA